MIAAILAGLKAVGDAALDNIRGGRQQPQQEQAPAPAPAPYTPGPVPEVNQFSHYDPGPQLPTMTGLPKFPNVPAPQIQDPSKRKLDVMQPQ